MNEPSAISYQPSAVAPGVEVGPVTYEGRRRVTMQCAGVLLSAETWRLALAAAVAAGIPESARVRETLTWGPGVADFDFSWDIPAANLEVVPFEAMPWEDAR